MPQPDVVVVGAGTAGCALAARLADAGRRVLVLEAGPVPGGEWPAEIRDATSLAATAPGHPANWDLPAEVVPGRSVRVPRGRIAGGSSALNAAVWMRATRHDLDGWAAAGNPLWAHGEVLPAYRRSEADADYGRLPGHGADGPVPVEHLTVTRGGIRAHSSRYRTGIRSLTWRSAAVERQARCHGSGDARLE